MYPHFPYRPRYGGYYYFRPYNYMNVYVVDADGGNLKRPSDAPSIPELAMRKRVGSDTAVTNEKSTSTASLPLCRKA